MRISDWSSDVCSSDLFWIEMGGAYPTGHHRLAICPGHLGNLLKRAARPDCGGFERLPGKPEPPANQPIAQFKAALNPNRMATCTQTGRAAWRGRGVQSG